MRLLIADDEMICRKGMGDILAKHCPDVQVFPAANGLEALALLETEEIDAMLLDIRMPKCSGFELLEKMREKRIDGVVTVIVSGIDDFEYARTAIRSGVFEYLLKPITPGELLDTLQRLRTEIERQKRERAELSDLRRLAEQKRAPAANAVYSPQPGTSHLTEQICRYVAEHYAEPINNAVIADAFGYSPNYLGRSFREETGANLNDYIKDVRIERAKELLAHTAMRVSDIARETGFADGQYFSVVFRQRVGVSPSDYREAGK